MRIVTVEEPAIEPVTLAEAKLYSRVDIDEDDSLIEMFITSARIHVEQYCNIALITQTKAVYYDYRDVCLDNSYIPLPFGPVQSVESFDSVGNDNTSTVFPPISYFLSGGRVVLGSGYYWPSDVRGIDSYKIEAVVGYGDNAEDVPVAIRQAILRLVAHWYQNREAIYDSVNGSMVPNNVPYSVTNALMSYRVFVL